MFYAGPRRPPPAPAGCDRQFCRPQPAGAGVLWLPAICRLAARYWFCGSADPWLINKVLFVITRLAIKSA